jgi:SAM-dependent methyltransferase
MPALVQSDVAFQANLYNDSNPTRQWLHRERRSWLEAHLDAILPTVGLTPHIIEIGVGAGIYTRFLVSKGCLVSAIDICPAFLDAVKDLKGVTVMSHDATQPLPVSFGALAICSEVLEHVPPTHSQAVLNNIFAALKPGGYLLLTTPQRFSTLELAARTLTLKPVLALARLIYGHAAPLGHINLLTAGALRAQIQAAGFEVHVERRLGLYIPVLAEFGGHWGRKVATRLAHGAERSFARSLLWTQAYVLRRPKL